MTKNPKDKGSSFERKVAKDLSLWLTAGKSSKELIRSVLSGGWKDRGIRQVGDLAPNGEAGWAFRKVAAVECKHHKEINFWHVFSSDKPLVLDWWAKHSLECFDAGIQPFLIMKQNYFPTLLGMRPSFYEHLGHVWFGESFLRCGYNDSLHEEVIFVEFEDFLTFDHEFILEKLNEICGN